MVTRRHDAEPVRRVQPHRRAAGSGVAQGNSGCSGKASAEGIDIRINSGWRSKGFQQRLFDDGVRTYGSVEKAKEFVASPETSNHVKGKAVDIAPVEADKWLIRNGPQFGLCQIYANEIWHFELAVDDQGRCPPLKPNAAG